MAELNRNYNKIISELEERIKNPQELEFVKSKISELTLMFMDTVDSLVENSDKIVRMEKQINKIQKSLKTIEEDIYINDEDDDDEECNCDECEHEYCMGDQMHDNDSDEDYEFEIVCPYCNHEFVTGKEANLKDEIECPNCHNIIELDWDDYCDGECNHCKDICYSQDEEEAELEVNEDEANDYKITSSENDEKDKKNNKKENEKQQENNENEDDM